MDEQTDKNMFCKKELKAVFHNAALKGVQIKRPTELTLEQTKKNKD